jgi:hypothetical protein
MDKHTVGRIQLAYFGTADPAFYGIDAIYQPGTWSSVFSKQRSNQAVAISPYIAISATHLAGVYFRPPNPYKRYLDSAPVAIIGGSIYVYKITE